MARKYSDHRMYTGFFRPATLTPNGIEFLAYALSELDTKKVLEKETER